MTSQLEHYENLVRDIYPKFDLEVARFVDQALGKVRKDSSVLDEIFQIPSANLRSLELTTPVTRRSRAFPYHHRPSLKPQMM